MYWFSGGLFLLPHPLSLGQGQRSVSWLPAVSVLCWFADCFQFCSVVWLWMLLTGSGDELCDCYLPYFRQQLITCPLSAFLPFQSLFTESSHGTCPSPLLQCAYSTLPPLLHVPCLLFSLVFCRVGVSFCPGGYAGLSQGWLGNTAWCLWLTCWSAEYLPSRFRGGVWQRRSPPVFSV
jgi:hypothetical protein